MDHVEEKERDEIFRGQGLHRFEGVSPNDLYDEFYSPRSDVQLAANPERTAMVREMVGKLSVEAKEVLRIVVDVPAELAEYVLNSGNRMNRHVIREYLRYCDWKFLDIEGAFKEIRNFLKSF